MRIPRSLAHLPCIAALSTGLLLTVAGTAEAGPIGIFLATFRGVVSSGADTSGVFGGPNTNLGGDAFTVQFTIDRSTPGALEDFNPPTTSTIQGTGPANPVTADILINGHDYRVAPTGFGWIFADAGFYNQEYRAQTASSTGASVVLGMFNQGHAPWANWLYFAPLHYDVMPGDQPFGSFSIDEGGALASGRLSVTSLDVTHGAPEPATWAMMLLGFGGLGALLRRARSLATA